MKYEDAMINLRYDHACNLLTKRLLPLLTLAILRMQLLIANCEEIALKIHDAILHTHGEKNEGCRDNTKRNKKQSK